MHAVSKSYKNTSYFLVVTQSTYMMFKDVLLLEAKSSTTLKNDTNYWSGLKISE